MDRWQRIAAILGFLAVALGAFGAHALEDLLVQGGVEDTWKTAVLYHLVHGAAILAPVTRVGKWPPALFFSLGIVFFSGSLYVLCLSGVKVLGAITPIGGVLFLTGWLRLLFVQDNTAGSAGQ